MSSRVPPGPQQGRGSFRGRYSRGRGNYGPIIFRRRNRGRNDGSTSGSATSSNPPPSREKRCVPRGPSFKVLESLLNKDPIDVLQELSSSKKAFPDYLKSDLTPDGIVLAMKVLRRVCDVEYQLKNSVLQTCLSPEFLLNLKNYIRNIPYQQQEETRMNKYFWNDTDDFWNNLIKVFNDITEVLPTWACNNLIEVVHVLSVTMHMFESVHKMHISDSITEQAEYIKQMLEEKRKEFEEKPKTKQYATNEYEEPPDDFRLISVYPTVDEILGGEGFLRPNVIDGPYRDVNHYLDVQFRLLREDFVSPLRKGIQSYRNPSNKRLENVKVYKQVRFLNPEVVNEYRCIRLKFDFSKKKKSFNYENSKRFMFGALLCFTSDNFKTIIYGKVSERKTEDLENGELIVGFDHDVMVSYEVNYLMVECSVYFEPYYHVLSVLKTMSLENFPMERYIVQVNPNNQPPEYTMNVNLEYNIAEHFVNPLFTWPTDKFYNFNESQLIAFKAALTNEMAIIQGPPGTGKTYLALKIAKTLLDNKKYWYNNTPMLVICFTNHALDQFLEGITEFTHKVIRIGGQSKNENLNKFNIRNRKVFKMHASVYEMRNVVKDVMMEIKVAAENIKQIDRFDSIRNFEVFEKVIPQYSSSWFAGVTKQNILSWLLGNQQDVSPKKQQPVQWNSIEDLVASIKLDGSAIDDSTSSEDEDTDDNADVADDLFEKISSVSIESYPLVTVCKIQDELLNVKTKLEELNSKDEMFLADLLNQEKYEREFYKLEKELSCLQNRLREGYENRANPPMTHYVNLTDPYQMSPDERWALYFLWLHLYRTALLQRINQLNARFRTVYKNYEELRNIEDVKVMREVLVVGMTTTSAARLRSSLQTLKSPIVIVEEAAEVLEGHIITSLTSHCQHLVLIGDHQQLKPSSADYRVEKHYHLGISLFERMVRNNVQCYTLNVQHRMRPEISALITPTIYPDLKNHHSVYDRPSIIGVENNLYFIDHQHDEEQCEGTTKKNLHEALFLISFARHLILNGYQPEKITILAAYLGQMFEIQKEKKKHGDIMRNMRIAVLDNYQGEECDIILLSLVRSNNENKIGFLSIENRVCVALSRARNGFYIMGNMTQLCHASPLWVKIKATLEGQDVIGSELMLRCLVHDDTVTCVKSSDDFLNISEGGCNQICNADLPCGHNCKSLCHVRDRNHDKYKCNEPCGKPLCDKDVLHICRKRCYQDCGPCTYKVERTLECGHLIGLECAIDPKIHLCRELVQTTLPCGHIADMPCSCDPVIYKCPFPCEIRLDCGHACKNKCHIRKDPDHLEYKCTEQCARSRKDCSLLDDNKHACQKRCYEECDVCIIKVRKHRTVCPHVYDVRCFEDVDTFECMKPCTKILSCGHKCKAKCDEACIPCEEKLEKSHPVCNHRIKTKCSVEPDRSLCKKNCPLLLPCGHNCRRKCNEPCTPICKVEVAAMISGPCGHILKEIPCYVKSLGGNNLDLLLKCCKSPCGEKLECGHMCSGSCGKCLQGRIHKRCMEECGRPLVCNHQCEIPCRQSCKPCKRPCPYFCEHSKCKHECGLACIPCKQKCTRKCAHQACSKYCGDICDVKPCEEPCPRELFCGHPCIGFCGDPCPPKCLTCDKEEVTEAFFGHEDEEDARFVYLKECGHIIEDKGMKLWLEQNTVEKVCPRCKTPLNSTRRYSEYIKSALEAVTLVKLKHAGNRHENNLRQVALLKRISLNSHHLDLTGSTLRKVETAIGERLKLTRNNKRQQINKSDLDDVTVIIQIIEHIVSIIRKNATTMDDEMQRQIDLICGILLKANITVQEIDDIQLELNRLGRIQEYSLIKARSNTNNEATKNLVAQIESCLGGFRKFTDIEDAKTKALLEQLSKATLSGIGISDQEKREILKAMNFTQGHWYKCPNGHVYAIGECGGPMQESKCNECQAPIGGQRHSLTSGNSVATEMDGARYGAYSNQANMNNYDLHDLYD